MCINNFNNKSEYNFNNTSLNNNEQDLLEEIYKNIKENNYDQVKELTEKLLSMQVDPYRASVLAESLNSYK